MKNSKIIGLSQFPMSDLLQRLLPSNRNKFFDEFVKFKDNDTNYTILNISAEESDGTNNVRYVLTWNKPNELPKKIVVSLDPSSGERLFTWDAKQEVPSQQSHYGNLPFDDGAFDWIFCEAVIEHVGGSERQYLLLSELMRVVRKGIFVTTSNRWHPIEFYTALPLLHWLPASLWKKLLKLFGKEVWASDSMLNLLDAKALQKFVDRLPHKPQCSIGHIRFLGMKAYFFLQLKKQSYQNKVDTCTAYQS